MKKYTVIFVILMASIVNTVNAGIEFPGDARFNAYKERFLLKLWKIYPSWASSIGYHKYDQILIIPDNNARSKEIAFCRANLDSLKKIKLEELSNANKTDYHLIENQLRSIIWGIEKQKAWQWDPSGYNVCGSFAEMLANEYAPLEDRLHNFYLRMAAVPAYYHAAKANIKNPTKEHTALAIEQNTGGLSVFEQELDDALQRSKLSDKEKIKIKARAKEAATAITSYVNWLKVLKNDKPRSFRLGKELYADKFIYELQSGYTADEIYQKALAHKAELHEKMYKLTKKIWFKYLGNKPMPENKLMAIRMMIDELSNYHTNPEFFQSSIEHQLPELIKFIKKKDLIYIDPSKPLVVRKEPAYMAGVAGASINSPGPYDKDGNTYYNVGSLEGWDKDKAESYLREYNHYILPILNIHEAIPGHYTQLVYANRSPSLIKSVLGNNTMIEGWAVYTELMMLENGYDVDKDETSAKASPEMWLMYYKWNMRSTCNTILDYSVHTKNMSREEALDLLTNEAFQQKAEAEGKWRRVSLTQVQLCCYFTGFTEIYELREKLKERYKDNFDLKEFHERFLSFGSAPVKYIKEAMLPAPPTK